jgi:hypothetical protein
MLTMFDTMVNSTWILHIACSPVVEPVIRSAHLSAKEQYMYRSGVTCAIWKGRLVLPSSPSGDARTTVV